MSTSVQQPSARFCFFTAGLLYFESNSWSFCDAYCHGHTGSKSKWAIGFFWHRHREGAWNKLVTATLSWLSFIWDTLSHLTLLCKSLGNQWKEAPGFWLGLLSQFIMYVDHTSPNSHSSHTVVNVQVSCLSPWSLKLCNRCSCSPRARFKVPTCRFCHSLQYFTCCKRATGCDIIHSLHTFACVQLVYCWCNTMSNYLGH